jgi:4-hydroxybenzoate polyprenyltransferase
MRHPLIVDLDGTLIRNDLTHELLILCLRWKPHLAPLALYKLFVARSEGKRFLAQLVGHHVDPANLPYEPAVIDLIDRHRRDGVQIELVSGTDHLIVARVSEHLGAFGGAYGSGGGVNLVSGRKAEFLRQRHADGYLYVGNSSQDIEVWKQSKGGFGVRAPAEAYTLTNVDGEPVSVEEIAKKSSAITPLLNALRLHQWAKNLLLFVVPGLFVAELTLHDWLNLIQGFLCFGVMASATYLINDLFDIPDDRAHVKKRARPLAAGTLSVPLAVVLIVAGFLGSLAWAFLLDGVFGSVLAIYAFATVAYSFRLKRLPVVDVFILAGLFGIRVIAGAAIIQVPTSAWLLTFIALLFLSLALVKRYVEVRGLNGRDKISGRGYVAEDAPLLLSVGASAGFTSILSLVIYGLLAEHRAIDNSAIILAVASIQAGWNMRIWMLAGRGQLNEDPVMFAVKDKISLVCLAAIAALIGFEASRPIWSNWF